MAVQHPRLSLHTLVVALMAAASLPCAQAQTDAPAPAAQAQAAIPRELGKPEDDIKLDVRAYRVDGLGQLSPDAQAALAGVTAPYTGKGRSYEDLMNAVAAVTRHMQSEMGYYVGFAYLPEQKPEQGPDGAVVRIYALEGRLERVRVNWPDKLPVDRDVIERYLAALQPGQVLRVRELERAAYLINDLQGVHARFEIAPGQAPGTAELVVTPQADASVTGRIEADSLGSPYTGIGRAGGLATWVSPTGRGDALSVNALGSFTGGLGMGVVSYVLPVGAGGLKLGASLSKMRYQLDADLFAYDLDGTVDGGNLFGLYPVVRSRNLNLFGVLSYERKRFTDNVDAVLDSRKTSDDVQAGVMGDFRDTWLSGGVNTFEANWLQGHIRFDDGTPPTGVDRNYGRLALGYSRLQNVVANRVLLYARYKAQLANANLDATERLAIGGPSGVRAYAPGEGAADTAHLATLELRLLPTGSWFESWLGRTSRELSFSAFYDWGHAQFFHDEALQTPGLSNTATYSGYGLGAVWERPGNFALRLNIAWRAAGEPEAQPNTHMPRANAVLVKNF